MAQKITVERLRKFRSKAKPRDELHGDVPGFYFIVLQSGGAWRLRYTNQQGKRKTVTLGSLANGDETPQVMADLAAEWRRKIREGVDPQDVKRQTEEQLRDSEQESKKRRFVNTGVFFDEIYKPHIKSISSAGQGTANIINSNFGSFFDRDMDHLTAADIRAWENDRKKSGVSRATLVRAWGAFKGMLNYAAGVKNNDPNDDPVISENPLKSISLSRMTATERDHQKKADEEMDLKRDLLGESERKKIQAGLEAFANLRRLKRANSRKHGKPHLADLDAVAYPHWFIPFAHIARLTGMRPGDVRRLRWSDIRQDFRSKTQVLQFTPHKTSHHADPIAVSFPITGELDYVLSEWRAQQGNPKTGYIFINEQTGNEMGSDCHRKAWADVKEFAGVRKEIHFYCFRHNFISDLVNSGLPLLKIARLVGHKNTDMIAKNYYRQDLDDMAGLIRALGGGWSAPDSPQEEEITDSAPMGAVR